MTDSDDKRRFPPRQVSADVTRAKEVLVGAEVFSAWLTDVDGWLSLAIGHEHTEDHDCIVLVNPTDIRFLHP